MRWYKGIVVAKDPDAVLTWRWDWSDWLSETDVISSHIVSVNGSVLSLVSGNDDTTVDVTLSGGDAGTDSDVTVTVLTGGGLADDRTVTFRVSEQ